MQESLIIFLEDKYFFGLLPTDFDQFFSLNKAWISPTDESSPVWKFEREEEPHEGNFVHFGNLLGLSAATFSEKGYVFLKKVSETSSQGVFINQFIMRVALKKMKERNRIEVDEANVFPPDIPRTAFRYVQHYKRKNIMVLDPLMLFRAYDIK